LRTLDELIAEGESTGNFFLTSRLQVTITADGAFIVPGSIINSIRTAMAARLVLDLRIVREAQMSFSFLHAAKGVNILYTKGTTTN
jgi:hypothetical protein